MARYNIRCQGIPLGNFFLSKTILFCIETFDHMKFYKGKEKGKHEIKKMIPNRKMFLRLLEFLLPSSVFHRTATERHSAARGRGGSLGLHTGNQWHRRIDSCASRWKEILTVCTTETVPRAAAVGIFTVPDYVPASSISTYFSVTSRPLTKRSVTKQRWHELRTIVNCKASSVPFVKFRFCVSYVYLFKTQIMVLLNFVSTNLCSSVVKESRANIS